MKLFKPSTWFQKKPVPSHVFAMIYPDHPHRGLDHFSADEKCPYKYAVKVEVSMDDAKLHLTGKVLGWDKFSELEINAIEAGKPPRFTLAELQQLYV